MAQKAISEVVIYIYWLVIKLNTIKMDDQKKIKQRSTNVYGLSDVALKTSRSHQNIQHTFPSE